MLPYCLVQVRLQAAVRTLQLILLRGLLHLQKPHSQCPHLPAQPVHEITATWLYLVAVKYPINSVLCLAHSILIYITKRGV